MGDIATWADLGDLEGRLEVVWGKGPGNYYERQKPATTGTLKGGGWGGGGGWG